MESETILKAEGMVKDMIALSCDEYEFAKAFCCVAFRSEAGKYFFRSIIEIVERKRPLMIEMKR